MSDLFAVTIDEMIAELEREVEIRRRVFPRWVMAGKLKQDLADRRIAILEAAAGYLRMEKVE